MASLPATGAVRLGQFSNGAENIALPLYSTNSPRPVAVLRAKRVFGDYERRGFFRIGILPTLAIEGITLEISDATQLGFVLERAALHLTVPPEAKRLLDGRDVSVIFPAQTNLWLRARRLRVEKLGTWRLEDVTVGRPNVEPVSFRRASLHLVGERAGELDTPDGMISLRSAASMKPSSETTARTTSL